MPAPTPRPTARAALPRARGTIGAMVAILTLAATPALVATPALAGAPPVELDGKVNDEGTGKAKGKKVTIETVDFAFDKTFVEVEPTKVKVKIVNDTSTPHTFTIEDQDVDKVMRPGKRAKVKVQVDGSEPVVFFCRFHESVGMQGALFVEAGGSAPARTPSSSERSSTGGSGYYDS